MKNNEKLAFFLDIDGTLFTKGEIPQINKDAVKAAQAAGHKVFINTGRSMGHVPSCVLEAGFDGFCAGIGCHVIYQNRPLLRISLPKDEVAAAFDYFTSSKRGIILEGEKVMVANKFCGENKFDFAENGSDFLEKFGDEPITKIFIPHVLSEDELNCFGQKYLIFQQPNYAEFSQKGYSKATGMQLLLDESGIDREHCVAMGDSVNDIDMLKYAKFSVAMGDAQEQVKEVCSHISSNADQGGVGEAIYSFIKL